MLLHQWHLSSSTESHNLAANIVGVDVLLENC